MNVLSIVTVLIIFTYSLNGQSSIGTFEKYDEICTELDLGTSYQNKILWKLGIKIENLEKIENANQDLIKKTIKDEIAPNLIYNYLVSKSIFQIEVLSESLEKIEGQETNLTYKCRVLYESTNGIEELKNQRYIYLCVDKGYNNQGVYFTTAHSRTIAKGGKYFVNVKRKKDKFFITNDSKIEKCKVRIGKDSINVGQLKKIIRDLNTLI